MDCTLGSSVFVSGIDVAVNVLTATLAAEQSAYIRGASVDAASVTVCSELNHGKQTALETMATGVVVEPDFGRQLVLLGRCVDLQIGSDTIRAHLDSLDLSAQVLIRRRNTDVHLTKMAVAVNDIRGIKL